eukprot:3593182-Pleurochrysis_carterae.AAC.1
MSSGPSRRTARRRRSMSSRKRNEVREGRRRGGTEYGFGASHDLDSVLDKGRIRCITQHTDSRLVNARRQTAQLSCVHAVL